MMSVMRIYGKQITDHLKIIITQLHKISKSLKTDENLHVYHSPVLILLGSFQYVEASNNTYLHSLNEPVFPQLDISFIFNATHNINLSEATSKTDTLMNFKNQWNVRNK